MTAAEYRTAREKRGTQQGVALRLGVHWRTIQDRENDRIPITVEAALALCALKPLRKKKHAPRRPNHGYRIDGGHRQACGFECDVLPFMGRIQGRGIVGLTTLVEDLQAQVHRLQNTGGAS